MLFIDAIRILLQHAAFDSRVQNVHMHSMVHKFIIWLIFGHSKKSLIWRKAIIAATIHSRLEMEKKILDAFSQIA